MSSIQSRKNEHSKLTVTFWLFASFHRHLDLATNLFLPSQKALAKFQANSQRKMPSGTAGTADNTPPPSLCPITLESLPESDLDVGVVWGASSPFDGGDGDDSKNDNHCSHCRCSLDALVRYVQGVPVVGRDGKVLRSATAGTRGSSSLVCPVCHDPIRSICDGATVKLPVREKANIVSFRYGKHNYYLSVPSSPEKAGWFRQTSKITAQHRIASVLGMNMKSGGLKILYKGKVICPDPKKSADEMSKQLLDLSNASGKGSKPSLVVMGTRSGDEVISAPDTASSSYRAGMLSLLRWGVVFLFNTTRNILDGLVLFAKSLFIMPAAPNDGRSHGE